MYYIPWVWLGKIESGSWWKKNLQGKKMSLSSQQPVNSTDVLTSKWHQIQTVTFRSCWIRWFALTQVRCAVCLLAPSDLEEALSKRWTSLSRAKAFIFRGGRQVGRQGGCGTDGGLFTDLNDLFTCILREQNTICLKKYFIFIFNSMKKRERHKNTKTIQTVLPLPFHYCSYPAGPGCQSLWHLGCWNNKKKQKKNVSHTSLMTVHWTRAHVTRSWEGAQRVTGCELPWPLECNLKKASSHSVCVSRLTPVLSICCSHTEWITTLLSAALCKQRWIHMVHRQTDYWESSIILMYMLQSFLISMSLYFKKYSTAINIGIFSIPFKSFHLQFHDSVLIRDIFSTALAYL